MAGNSGKGTFRHDSDIHISYEDQQKINVFARLNAKLVDLSDSLKVKESDLESLEDACDEITLLDDDEQIPYLIGEIFIYQNLETTEKCLAEAKKVVKKEMEDIDAKVEEVKGQMSELKSQLYEKFGSHINLEADD